MLEIELPFHHQLSSNELGLRKGAKDRFSIHPSLSNAEILGCNRRSAIVSTYGAGGMVTAGC